MTLLTFKLDLCERSRHRIRVELEIPLEGWPCDDDAARELFLPSWTPGSYLVRDYARHIETFTIRDADLEIDVPWRKSAKNRFLITAPESCRRLAISYSVYCRELSVRTADVTAEHAYWNGACLFVWPVGLENTTARIEVSLPTGWQMQTSLPIAHEDDLLVLEATGLDELVDSPCLAGTLDVQAFTACGRQHLFAFDGLAGLPVPTDLVPQTQRIIEEAVSIFGDPPPYDDYRFLSLFADVGRGGLEHLSSSTLLAPRTTFARQRDRENFMGLVAHEFFHVWNGKRMRPAELWDIDYERENYTPLLWVVEGWTAYYDDLLCLRAGVLDSQRYLAIVAENITNLQRFPGRLTHSIAEASFDAWIKLYRPDENSRNSSHSYYTSGALAAMCLDLLIRARTQGQQSLDDAIAHLFRETYGKSRGYTEEDVVACLSRAADEDLSTTVNELVHGPFDPNFEARFADVGLRLIGTASEAPFLGLQIKDRMKVSSVLRDSPAALAGLSPDDELMGIAGLRVTSANWKKILEHAWQPDRPLTFLVSRRGCLTELEIVPVAHPHVQYRIELAKDAPPSSQQLGRAWLSLPDDPEKL